jgi:bla regulator protein blaR1
MRPTFAALLLLTAKVTASQSPTFEVATVKPSRPGSPAGARLDAAQFTCSGMALRGLVFSAYRIPAWRLSGGPDWLDSDPWDIAATLPPNMPAGRDELTRQADLMLQVLLADRFQLKLHREMRDQPVYELVLSKSGAKLKPSATDKFSVKMDRGHLEFHHVSMAVLTGYLYVRPGYFQQATDRPVLDKTGLQGFFDLTLDWAPDSGPSLFTALEEQTGLKLEPRKSPFEFLVIDHVEKPVEN